MIISVGKKTEKYENKYAIKADGIILTEQKYKPTETKKNNNWNS